MMLRKKNEKKRKAKVFRHFFFYFKSFPNYNFTKEYVYSLNMKPKVPLIMLKKKRKNVNGEVLLHVKTELFVQNTKQRK